MATLLAVTTLFGLGGIRQTSTLNAPSYSRFEAGIYEAFAKTAWSASLAWVTVACTKGYGGVINSFLSWGVFQPLAKLSYFAYLIHTWVIYGFSLSLSYELPQGYWPQVIIVTATYNFFSKTCV